MQVYIPPPPESLPSAPFKAAAKSIECAHRLIQGYIKSESSREFQLVVSEVIVRKIANLFPKIVEQEYVITFCPSSSILLIVPMPTPVHNIITSFLHYSMTEWVGSGFLTADVYKHIQFMPPASKLPRGQRRVWKKESDCLLGFGVFGQKLIPRVAIEVGFSQPYGDLISDVCAWLRRERRLSIVILVNIDEDLRVLREIQSSEGFQHRARGLLSLYGNTAGQGNNWISVEESDARSESDQTLYDSIDRSITDSDWVGPLTATLEIWCRSGDGVPIRREEPEVRLLLSCSVIIRELITICMLLYTMTILTIFRILIESRLQGSSTISLKRLTYYVCPQLKGGVINRSSRTTLS